MNNKILIGVVVVLAGLGIGWFVLRGARPTREVTEEKTAETTEGAQLTPQAFPEETGDTTTAPAAAGAEKGGAMEQGETQAARAAVSYTDSGFSAASISVKSGTTVVFTNQSSKSMWVASVVHPTHQLLPGFDQLKSVGKGGSYEYTFTKVGTWRYHNHVSPSDTATVIVTQ